MISKAIKELPRKLALDRAEKEPTKIGRALAAISYAFKMYVYYPVDSFISRYTERTLRSLAFAKHGWLHYDFESAYIYDLMAFKMKRIHKCLENGHAVQDDADMNALKEAIAICERLFAGNYEDKYYEAHSQKWGEMDVKTTPEYDSEGKIKRYTWDSSRPKAKTAAQMKKERADLRRVWKNGEKDRRADLDRLNEILKRHEPTWWD